MKRGLNCGSGQRPFTSTAEVEWLNIDAQAECYEGHKPDVIADCKHMDFAADASADYVVFHHCWEHEGCGEAMQFQRESWRVLKPGGSLIVTVPDMRALAVRWLRGGMDDQLYFTNVYGAYHGDEHDRHRWGYTGESLVRELLETYMWSRIGLFDWRSIPGASIAKDFWILGVEAVK